jgi:hypothetical protein
VTPVTATTGLKLSAHCMAGILLGAYEGCCTLVYAVWQQTAEDLHGGVASQGCNCHGNQHVNSTSSPTHLAIANPLPPATHRGAHVGQCLMGRPASWCQPGVCRLHSSWCRRTLVFLLLRG